jgi:phosphoribosylanthranilate isomerase
MLPNRADGLPLIKMCGLRRSPDIVAATEAGADLIGMVFAPSRRRMSVEEARAALDEGGAHPPLVGVFVNEAADTMRETVRRVGISIIQLSGDEDPNEIWALDTPYIRVIHLRDGGTADEALRRMERWTGASAFLLDSWSPLGGGSGRAPDWAMAADIIRRAPGPVLLAGGLHADNVWQAMSRTAPKGVDVSSGIERAGWKDSARMKAFAAAARKGEES